MRAAVVFSNQRMKFQAKQFQYDQLLPLPFTGFTILLRFYLGSRIRNVQTPAMVFRCTLAISGMEPVVKNIEEQYLNTVAGAAANC